MHSLKKSKREVQRKSDMRSKVISYLGFAAKARKIVNGYNTCIFMMEKRKVKLLVLAEDLAEIGRAHV